MLKIAVCVSGGGTNLQAIIDGIEQKTITNTEIAVVISNNPGAYALERAKKHGIEAVCISPKEYESRAAFNEDFLRRLDAYEVDLVVLAGFLVVIPEQMIAKYRNRIINIHPSLIPSFCGTGYYGLKVHEGALARGVKVTGATVHFVDEGTDTGPIILQKAVEVQEGDTPEILQRRVMEQAEYYKLPVYAGMQQEMQPVYPLTSGLSNKTFQKAIMATRELICQMDDYVPEEVRAEHSLMELSEAYENIHFPMNQAVLKNAIRRLAFDEFYQFLYDMASMKKTTQLQENLHKIVQGKAVADYISNLPFSLTKGQQQAIEDILADMGGDGVMNRLIQGDVGSGKTVVAAAALLACAKAGYQGALMAPTEVLARQHYEELAEQFAQYDIRTACLVGSTPLKEKRRI